MMKLQFDPNQQYQLNAVAAVVGLFEGQPQQRHERQQNGITPHASFELLPVAHLISGASSKVWYGAGEGTVHSSPLG